MKFLVLLGKGGFWLLMKTRLYFVWSRIYRALFEGKRAPVREFKTLTDLVLYVRGFKWRADSWRQLFDAVGHPEHVEWLAQNDPDKFIGDCDEFAVYQAHVISTQPSVAESWHIKKAEVMSVTWYKFGGEAETGNPMGYGGHNVCLIQLEEGKWCYQDYGFPSAPRDTIYEVANDARVRYAPQSVLLGYVRYTPTLKFIEVGIE